MSWTSWVGAPKLSLLPGAGNPRYATALDHGLFGLCANPSLSIGRRMSAKVWNEWHWVYPFYGVENWLLLRIKCARKRLNPFFRLHEASEVLNKYIMWVWSDNFTGAFFVSFIVTVFVPDVEGIQNKVTRLWIGTTCSVNVTSTCSANLYDISRRKPRRSAPDSK